MRQGRRHHEMHHVRPGRRLFKHMAVGDGQPHPLAGDEMLHHWKEPHLPHGVLVVRGLAGGDDPHLVAVVLQRLGKTPCADGGAVVRVVKLVDDQNDLHKRLNRSFLTFPSFLYPVPYFFSLTRPNRLVHRKTRIRVCIALIIRKELLRRRKRGAGSRPLFTAPAVPGSVPGPGPADPDRRWIWLRSECP